MKGVRAGGEGKRREDYFNIFSLLLFSSLMRNCNAIYWKILLLSPLPKLAEIVFSAD